LHKQVSFRYNVYEIIDDKESLKLKKRWSPKHILCSVFIILLGVVLMSGCGHAGKEMKNADAQATVPSQKRPKDFTLSLYYDTGPLPAEHFYYYSITIGPENVCRFEFLPGRGEPPAPEVYVQEFSVSSEGLDALYAYLKEHGLFKEDWQKGEDLDGAPNITIAITANKRQYETGPIPELGSEDYRTANNAFEYILGYVPEEIWQEMQKIQDDYFSALEYEQ
jgi:hypothetical protein